MIDAVIYPKQCKDLSDQLLGDSERLILRPAEFYHKLDWQSFRLFCHDFARYGIVTTELIEWLKSQIGDRSAIEIGAGSGDLGFHLGIPMVDNKQQDWPDVAARYKFMMQPTIKYPKDVEEIDALDAVMKYKPQVVVASWITPYSPVKVPYNSNPHGIKEEKILDLVDTLIIIGNLEVHWDKPIRQVPHETLYFPWIISRAKNPETNRIFLWNRK